MIFLRIVIALGFLFEHDLRANAFRVRWIFAGGPLTFRKDACRNGCECENRTRSSYSACTVRAIIFFAIRPNPATGAARPGLVELSVCRQAPAGQRLEISLRIDILSITY